MQDNLILEGFKFAILGMGTVFLFLAILVLLLNLQAKLVAMICKVENKEVDSNKVDLKKDFNKKLSAISCAINLYRKNKNA